MLSFLQYVCIKCGFPLQSKLKFMVCTYYYLKEHFWHNFLPYEFVFFVKQYLPPTPCLLVTVHWLTRVCSINPQSSFFNLAEPRLCWETRTTWESEDQLSLGRHDGSWPPDHHPGQTGQCRFHWEHHLGEKVLHSVQALWGAADQTGRVSYRHSSW